EAMRQRDVIAARRFYEFAASAGVAGAASALARTYDPLYLQQLGIRGVKPDTEVALRWYKRASTEGDPAARRADSAKLTAARRLAMVAPRAVASPPARACAGEMSAGTGRQ